MIHYYTMAYSRGCSVSKKRYTCPKGHRLNDDVPYCMICCKSFTRVQPKPITALDADVGIDSKTFDANCPDGRGKR